MVSTKRKLTKLAGKTVKKSWKKAVNLVKTQEPDSYVTLPSDYSESYVKMLWNDLESTYFNFEEDNIGIAKKHKVKLGDYKTFYETFSKSVLHMKDYPPLYRFDDLMSRIHQQQAERFEQSHYHLRSTSDVDYNENNVQVGQSSDSYLMNLFVNHEGNKRLRKVDVNLYIEALMFLEPIIDQSDRKLRSVAGSCYDHEGDAAFKSEKKQVLYFTELASSVLSLYDGLDKVRGVGTQKIHGVNGPDMEIFVHWYLAHMGNCHKLQRVMYVDDKDWQQKEQVRQEVEAAKREARMLARREGGEDYESSESSLEPSIGEWAYRPQKYKLELQPPIAYNTKDRWNMEECYKAENEKEYWYSKNHQALDPAGRVVYNDLLKEPSQVYHIRCRIQDRRVIASVCLLFVMSRYYLRGGNDSF